MALMTRCCCWNVKGGSFASGVYTFVTVLVALIYYIYQFVVVGETNSEITPKAGVQSYSNSVAAMSSIGFIIDIYIIVACIILFFGVNRDTKWMLIPFMVAKLLQLFFFAVILFVFIYAIVVKPSVDVSLILYLVVAIPFVVIDVDCTRYTMTTAGIPHGFKCNLTTFSDSHEWIKEQNFCVLGCEMGDNKHFIPLRLVNSWVSEEVVDYVTTTDCTNADILKFATI